MSAPVEPDVLALPFDPCDRLPAGTTVLEASAGTGKTHAVASIVIAEVAAGRPLEELLVVTFTRKATGTLRDRIWHRLWEASQALDRRASGGAGPTDPLLAHLADVPPDELGRRRDRLRAAVSGLDAATIATTHGFCQQVLASLGVAGDAERDLAVVETVRDLVEEAVDDLFVRRFHDEVRDAFDRADAVAIADVVMRNPDAELAAVDEHDRLRRRFAVTLRQRITEQKRRGRIVTYDDLLARLAGSIDDPIRGEIVAERLRRRYTMAIVDEFQDTDSVQWRILHQAFGADPSHLVVVGDPKQAVYAFRGGDVHAYLQATSGATTRRRLDVSWRADQPLLDALDVVFDGAALGHPEITHEPVRARPGAEGRRLVGPAVGAPLTVRILDRASGFVRQTPKGWAQKGPAIERIATDVAEEARRLLQGDARLGDRDLDGSPLPERPLRPSDVAVLVRRHSEAELVRDALVAAGVPAVVHGGADVRTTPAGRAWLDLLRALEAPTFTARVRAVAHGPFVGWSATRLATATDDDWEELDETVHEWAAALRTSGIGGLLRRVEARGRLTERLSGEEGGDRRLADLRHLAEMLDGAHRGGDGSVAALAAWLDDQLRDGLTDADEGRRRLASDADAVAVHTIHGAKGLEFGVVLVPTLWTAPWEPDHELPVFHDAAGRRSVGVGSGGERHRWQVARARQERVQEELRLCYVALTRARHRVVVWWATAAETSRSPLARLLFGRVPGSREVPDELDAVPDETAVRARVAELAARSGGAVEVLDVTRPPRPRTPAPPSTSPPLSVAVPTRALDHRWVRTSYSGLTAVVHELGPPPGTLVLRDPVGPRTDVVEAAEQVTLDEPSEPDARTAPPVGHPLARPLPLGEVPGGARIGTMVHDVLEHTDFAAPDLPVALRSAAVAAGAARAVEEHLDALVGGLAAAVETPLGPSFGGLRLRDLGRADRLDELAFDLPLAGGDHPSGIVTMAAIADVFAAELRPDDPLAGYDERLRDPLLTTEVRGYLTGSIDLVARHRGRHVVIDHKTNRLAPAGEVLTSWHYRPEALVAAMVDAHYPLQAALYSVALHRYLRWRLPGYRPEQHLGGVAYLFLRGMDGRLDGDAPCGVFAWHPPARFVTRLSEVLDAGVPR